VLLGLTGLMGRLCSATVDFSTGPTAERGSAGNGGNGGDRGVGATGATGALGQAGRWALECRCRVRFGQEVLA
jgi:hypothetical protein